MGKKEQPVIQEENQKSVGSQRERENVCVCLQVGADISIC